MEKISCFILLIFGCAISGVYAEPALGPVPDFPKTDSIEAAIPSTLTLDRALQLAIKNNVQLRMAEMDVWSAQAEARGESYYMEPDLVVEASAEEGKRKNTVEQSVSLLTDTFEEENSRYSAAIEGVLPVGTTYSVGYKYADLANNLTSTTFPNAFSNQYSTYVGINITQPLLKNFGMTYTRRNLLYARLRHEVAVQNLRKQKMLSVANTVLAYGSVWMQQELVKARRRSLDNAQELLKDNEMRRSEGKMAAIEVAAARAGVVKRETEWLDAQTQWRDAQNEFANLLSAGIDLEPVELQAMDEGLPKPLPLSGDHLLDGLVERHPDILIKQREVESSKLQVKIMKNQHLPELNVEGNYGRTGLGATSGDSHDDIGDGEFDSWDVGVVLRVGLVGNKQGKYQLIKAKVDLERSRAAYDYVEKEVGNRLMTSLHKVNLLCDAVLKETEAVKINTQALDAQKQMLAVGKSKTVRLLEVEEDLLEAQEDLLRVRTLYRNSLVEMQLANARILDEYGIE